MSLLAHQSPRSKSDDWLTPPSLLRQLGEFDLDPCCPANMPWPTAATMWTRMDNALTRDWHGMVFLNPPFGRASKQFVERLAAHDRGIALLPARTETDVFHRFVWNKAKVVLFIRGRVYFCRPDGTVAKFNSGMAMVLVGYGPVAVHRLKKLDGTVGRLVGA